MFFSEVDKLRHDKAFIEAAQLATKDDKKALQRAIKSLNDGSGVTISNNPPVPPAACSNQNLEKWYTEALDKQSIIKEMLGLLKTKATKVINGIKNICYNNNERVYLCSFLYKTIEALGYKMGETNCYNCKEDIAGRVFFRYKDAVFACQNCCEEDFKEIRQETLKTLNLIKKESFDSSSLTEDGVNKLLKFLFYYLYVKTDVKLKTQEALEKI